MLLDKRINIAYVINKVKFDLTYTLVLCLVVIYVTNEFESLLPEMPLTIPAFIGTAISILLSFKLAQSYDRWWEARKIWGAIVNDSRSFVLQIKSLTERGNETTVKKLAYRQIAWCYSLGQSLRGLNPLENIAMYLSEDEMAAIGQHQNKPLALLHHHSEDVKYLKQNKQLDVFSQLQIDSTLVRLCESQGKAERIKSTVFPITYRLFLHVIIYLFVVTLSLALSNMEIYFEIPLLILISSAFFLLEKTATHLQDPFENRPTDTAMTAIARTIEINIKQILKETDIPNPHPPKKFYLL